MVVRYLNVDELKNEVAKIKWYHPNELVGLFLKRPFRVVSASWVLAR